MPVRLVIPFLLTVIHGKRYARTYLRQLLFILKKVLSTRDWCNYTMFKDELIPLEAA